MLPAGCGPMGTPRSTRMAPTPLALAAAMEPLPDGPSPGSQRPDPLGGQDAGSEGQHGRRWCSAPLQFRWAD